MHHAAVCLENVKKDLCLCSDARGRTQDYEGGPLGGGLWVRSEEGTHTGCLLTQPEYVSPHVHV